MPRLLNPIDRIAEILFGLIMAVTIVGSISVATAAQAEVKTVTWAAIGCNLAWGLVDGVMYVLRLATARMRNRSLARQALAGDAKTATALIVEAMPEHIAAICGPAELEGMRVRLLGLQARGYSIVRPRDVLEAVGVFAVVVAATFPVVIPFLVMDDIAKAMAVSQAITVAMLFMAGFALARYGGHSSPLRAGVVSAVLGVALIAAVKALGG